MAFPATTATDRTSVPPLGVLIEIDYLDADGIATRRTVRPLTYSSGGSGRRYLRAYCYLRQDERTFRIDRIRSWKPAEGERTAAGPAQYRATWAEPAAAAPPPPPSCDPPTVIAAPQSNRSPAVGDCAGGSGYCGPNRPGGCSVSAPRGTGSVGRFLGLLAAAAVIAVIHFGLQEKDNGAPPRVAGTAISTSFAAVAPAHTAAAAATHPVARPVPRAPISSTYRGATITAAATGGARYWVPALARGFDTLRTAHLAINTALFERESGITSPALLSLYSAADSDGNGNLSWAEIVRFQARLERTFRYQANDTALRPDEFLTQGGGDCEDWALVTAGLLDYWGWNAAIAVFSDPYSTAAHAVCMVWSAAPIPGYGCFTVRTPVQLRTGTLEPGCYIPIDYQSVGALTSAVGRGWNLTAMYRPVSLYDRPM